MRFTPNCAKERSDKKIAGKQLNGYGLRHATQDPDNAGIIRTSVCVGINNFTHDFVLLEFKGGDWNERFVWMQS